jgi:hypothetical protein
MVCPLKLHGAILKNDNRREEKIRCEKIIDMKGCFVHKLVSHTKRGSIGLPQP